ncbi:MAG: hypothetical protein JWL93_407 [Hyphomicrobiales bacterium]|jgi:putative hemolysin|nr:hypothetical protein [Hyphomicrobiales bacterium]
MEQGVFSYADSSTFAPLRLLIRAAERLSGARHLESLYLQNRVDLRPGENWFAASLRRLQIDVHYDAAALAAAPACGPLLIVANHPFGVLDGIVLSALATQVRGDVLVLTNAVLLRAPEISDWVLPIDFASTREAQATNVASRARARQHLARGGTLIVFPAGEVSTSPDRLGRLPAVDARWQPFVAQLAERSRATVLPVYFEGRNSRVFQIASHIHSMLRLGLFFHELRRRIGTTVDVRIGGPIRFEDLPDTLTRQALADHLRGVTCGLADQPRPR